VVVSAFLAAAVDTSVAMSDLHAAIGVIGIWASLPGILQLATAVRRRKSARAQRAMILSGAQ
jgi:uncharacterized membrane protein HdeD (DUF308 family)